MMNTLRKSLAGLALGAGLSVSWMIGSSFVRDAQFARAQEQVQASREQIASIQDLSSVFNAVGKAVEPSVVNIDVVKNVPIPQGLGRFFGGRGRFPQIPQDNGNGNGNNDQNTPDQQVPPQLQEQGTGSGVIMEVDGDTAYVVTNNHVAGGAGDMKITLSDGRIIKDAKLVGADPKSDLAVVKFTADHVIAAKWGDSDKLEQGDFILAFGSPFRYIGSMTHGIVSATNRRADIINSDFAYENFIQVDAPINPGNSGGPLVNLHGEVVGINTAIATESGAFSGLGFAIPSNQVKSVFTSLKTSGKVVRGWLGVKIGDVADAQAQAKQLGYEGKDGVLVVETYKDTPAFDKLEPGDVVTELNGKKVKDTQELRTQIAADAPGTEVSMKVFRDGKQEDVAIKLGEQPDELGAVASAQSGNTTRTPSTPGSNQLSPESLGMTLNTANSDLLDRYSLDKGIKGAVVTRVTPRSLAYQAGLEAGDVITRVNTTPITSADEAADALSKADVKKGIQLRVTDRQSVRSVFIQSDEPLPQR